jgi:N-methylhydantoinase A
LEKSPEEAAEGILAVANTAMERALRVISVERGFDPGEFVLVAFGGAGALHVAELAEGLGTSRALVPPDPGLLSAYGMLASQPTRELSRTLLVLSTEEEVDTRLDQAFAQLEEQALEEMVAEGNDPATLAVRHWVDARYQGQSFEIRVPREDWTGTFHRAHKERYGYTREETPVEAVTLRAVVEGPALPLLHTPLAEADGPPPFSEGRVYHLGKEVTTKQVWRKDLKKGHTLTGPALVMEYSSTTWLPPEWSLNVDEWGSLHLMKE